SHLRDRTRPARGDLPAGFRRRSVRPDAACGLRQAAARGTPLRERRSAGRADASRRGRDPRSLCWVPALGEPWSELASVSPAMPLTKDRKSDLISKFGKSPEDTGSTEVQVALLT